MCITIKFDIKDGVRMDKKHDERDYQMKKEKEVSMKPLKKRDFIIHEVVNPLLKTSGFKGLRNARWKKLDDSLMLIHIESLRWNSNLMGACFGFFISVTAKDDIRTAIANQRLHNNGVELNQFDFLPHWGMLSPYYGGTMYKIDGYKNNLPSDTPIERISAQIREDFEDYVIPALIDIHNIDGWKLLFQEKKKSYKKKENCILRFFSSTIIKQAVVDWSHWTERYSLTKDDVLEHLDWLTIMEQHSEFPYGNMRARIVSYFSTVK